MIENFSNYWFKQFKAASNGRLLKVYNHFVQIDEVGDDIFILFYCVDKSQRKAFGYFFVN